jgi:hypothetical protein
MTGGGSYDEVDLEDMDWNESLKEFTYSCPCGDIFRITLEELKDGVVFARVDGDLRPGRATFDNER